MNLAEIAMLTFSCVAVNHLGLISAVEDVLKRRIPIVNCCKCFTFWSILFTTTFTGWDIVSALAVSFLFSWLSLWIELGMGFTDILYTRIYEKIYTTTDEGNESATDANDGDSDGTVS